MSKPPSLKQSQTTLLSSLAKAVRTCQTLPLGDDYDFLSAFPEYSNSLEEAKHVVLETNQSILEAVDTEEVWGEEDGEWVQERSQAVCEDLMERLDGFLSRKKVNEEVVRKRSAGTGNWEAMMANIVDMEKPQDTYNMVVDNARETAFVPKLSQKYHTDIPLHLEPLPGHGIQTIMTQTKKDSENIIAPSIHYGHPYQIEIQNLTYSDEMIHPPPSDITYKEGASCTWIDTEAQLAKLAGTLTSFQEIAVDLEAHSYRTYSGLTCLMQISLRDGSDYLIDTLKLRPCLHTHLAPIFANPEICKIMHGSGSDILWLQRDFGIYVVDLFDTGIAARQLGFPSFALSYLLQRYCGVKVDKKYQLYDWRQRPLPVPMREYARSDTRYLIRVYDCLRKQLHEMKNSNVSVESVLRSSNGLALRRFHKEPFYPMGYRKLLLSKKLNATQQDILKELWDWRDATARKRDESCQYVCPNSTLIKMASMGNLDSVFLTEVMKGCREDLMAVLEGRKCDSEQVKATDIFQMANWTTAPAATSPQHASTSSDEEEPNHVIELHPSNQEYTPSHTFFHISKKQCLTHDDAARVASNVRTEIRNRFTQVMNAWVDYSHWKEDGTNGNKEPPSSQQQQQTQPQEDTIPKSTQEIYQISQENRKKRKNKPVQNAPPQSENDETKDYFPKSKQKKTSDLEVMKEVGWVDTAAAEKKAKEIMSLSVGVLPTTASISNNPFFAGVAATAPTTSNAPQIHEKKKSDTKKQWVEERPKSLGVSASKTCVYRSK